jgi:hypothetical protein
MKKFLFLIVILLSLFACKKHIQQPVLDENDRRLLMYIKEYAKEGDSLLNLAKTLPDNSSLPLSAQTRMEYAQMYLKQAAERLENVKKMRYIADEIFAMKLKMYNDRSFCSKDTLIPAKYKACYEKLNYVESKLTYTSYIPNSLSEFSSDLSPDCDCLNK